MSIAVGEDLFPFFISTGKELEKSRFSDAIFLNQIIHLPIAPIDAIPPGNVRLDAIDDYTKPLLLA
jgi:hypothetical protein